MCEAEIKKHLNFAKSYGRKMGLSWEQAEDLAQRYVIKKFIDKTGQRIEQAYVDFMRSEYGDLRTEVGKVKSYARLNSAELETAPGNILELQGPDPDVHLTKVLSSREFFIYIMFRQGFTGRQIGDMLGLSNGRIFQIKKAMLKKMAPVDLSKDLAVKWIEL